MVKFSFVLMCVAVGMAGSLSFVTAINREENIAIRLALAPTVAECLAEYGLEKGKYEAAKMANDPEAVESCFLGCLLRKIGVLDSNGFYDGQTGLMNLRKYINSDADFAKFVKVASICNQVNDEPVNDGAAGCERAKLIFNCAYDNRAELLL